MATVRLDSKKIVDWSTFHSECKEAFGFPDFYGANMDAWIDCLTYLDEGDGMSKFHLIGNAPLHIEILDSADFRSRLPEIFDALRKCKTAVNERYEERESSIRLLINLI